MSERALRGREGEVLTSVEDDLCPSSATEGTSGGKRKSANHRSEGSEGSEKTHPTWKTNTSLQVPLSVTSVLQATAALKEYRL